MTESMADAWHKLSTIKNTKGIGPMDKQTRRYNIKLLFNQGKLDNMVYGDYGEATRPNKKPIDAMSAEDCLIAWPVDPSCTGKAGIVDILGLPITRRMQQAIKEDWRVVI